MGKFFQVFHVTSLVYLCLVGMLQVVSAEASNGPPDTLDFFFDRNDYPNVELSNITWEHGVNSREHLVQALEGNKLMLEADISMGSIDDLNNVPIMAHPPNLTSDLTFEEFLTTVLGANQKGRLQKGIKLDFKDIEAVEPCLKFLKSKQKDINFPVWLNADVLVGPVDSTKKPVDAEAFLNLTRKYYKKGTLSLGWTTRFGNDDSLLDVQKQPITTGSYTKKHVKAMIDFCDKFNVEGPSFPVRAALATKSTESLLNLLASVKRSTLTLFSSEDDIQFIDFAALNELISTMGRTKVYLDLPFDIQNPPKSPSPKIGPAVKVDNARTIDSSSTNDTNPSSNGDSVRGCGFQVGTMLALVLLSVVM